MSHQDIKKTVENALLELKPRSFNNAMFNMANVYNQISETSLEMIRKSKNADFAGPAIMCKSFSIELMLKFFISFAEHAEKYDDINNKEDLKGHKYTDLFDKIPENYKTIIAKYFSEISGKTMTIENFRKSLIDVGNTPFVKWRYIYEQKNINHMDINLLATIANALGLAGMELLKEEDS